MAGKAVPNFVASRDTLAFANDWPSQPDLVIKLPLAGRVKIGDASKGLCGGMVYAVRDFYEAGIPVPAGPQPAAGTPLYRYIIRRLFDSFDIPGGVVKYYTWMNTPEADQTRGGRTRRGIAWRTINEEWPQIRSDIDAGHPSPLGLVTVRSVNPRDLGRCHQVLAYAYDLEGSTLTLRLYDPNTDPAGADSCSLSLDLSRPSETASITHNVGIADPIRGFFRTRYDPADPSKAVTS
ncbi:MAG: hypothetical protein E6G66_13285 [Actinobacteria bacterium]|nr:MAG: hypothetical protein E6G66_13285 [Actinomycetota bacterium]